MKKNIVAIIQARLNSTRLPGKILKKINGISFLELQLKRLKKCKKITKVVLAFPDNSSSNPLINLAKKLGCTYFLGSEINLLSRYYNAAKSVKADYIIRLTSDCPLLDFTLIDNMITLILRKKYDIVTNVLPPSWPDGLDVNIFTKELLIDAYNNANLLSDKEHVVPWMWKNSNLKNGKLYRGYNYKSANNYTNYRWTLDNQLDLNFFSQISAKLSLKKLEAISTRELIDFFKKNKSLIKINADNIRDSGYIDSLKKDNEIK